MRPQTILVSFQILTSLTLTLTGITNAFVLQITKTSRDIRRQHQPTRATYDPYEGSFKGRDGMERNKARMDLRNFLTQRSIQSFVYLLNQCREEHTVRWLEVRYRDLNSIVKLANDTTTKFSPNVDTSFYFIFSSLWFDRKNLISKTLIVSMEQVHSTLLFFQSGTRCSWNSPIKTQNKS